MVSKEEISNAIWQRQSASDASIASRIRSARQAVGDDGVPQTVIRTNHGRGFRFVADVQERHSAKIIEQVQAVEPGGLLTTRPSIAILPLACVACHPN
ncbi:MAG: hypothetical protein JWS10_857 [Cypionkella sp.]|nr:hypothetical protein [Cypionkella sp.]